MEVEIPEVEVPPVEAVEDVVDAPAEVVTEEVLDAEVIEEVAAEIPAEDVAEDATEAEEVKTEEAVEAEPIVFDATAEDLLEQITPVLDKYEFPAEAAAAIEALRAKAEAVPASPIAEYADYGDEDAIKTLLERQSYFDTSREENGSYRPNTDKFVETLKSDDTRKWLFLDLGKQASETYPGVTLFQEFLINNFAQDGETPTQALERYDKLVDHLQRGDFPTETRPAFIPDRLAEAFSKLGKDSREEIASLTEYDDEIIKDKVAQLELIQKGLDSERREAQTVAQQRQQAQQSFQKEVFETHETFLNTFRDIQAKELMANVQFSTDPKMQALLAGQQIALLEAAFAPDAQGEFARKMLADAGIQFDGNKAQALLKDIEKATVELTKAKREQAINPIEFRKAKTVFEKTTKQWQDFAKDIITQEARLVSTGKAEEVKTEAAKIKITPKARAVATGSPSPATKNTPILAPMGSEKRYDQLAEMIQAEEAQKARAYA